MSTRAAARARRRPRRQVEVGKKRSSTLLLVGEEPRRSSVGKALHDLEVALELLDRAPRRPGRHAVGLALVPPLDGGRAPARVVAELRQSPAGKRIPIFVVIDDESPERTVRGLYAAGATAVFHWPREAIILPRLVAELLGVALVHGRAGGPRQALARTLRARLRLAPWASGVRVQGLGDGEIRLSGKIGSFWRKRQVEQISMQVPGVKGVDSRELRVEPSGLSDREIARGARAVLRGTASVDENTVAVAVHGGNVILAGTVTDRQEMRRILDVMAHVRGVRELTNSMVVSPADKKTDGAAVRVLRRRLEDRFPDEDVRVAVFSGVAVLSGKVSSLDRRRHIEELIDDEPSITKVIDKTEIA